MKNVYHAQIHNAYDVKILFLMKLVKIVYKIVQWDILVIKKMVYV